MYSGSLLGKSIRYILKERIEIEKNVQNISNLIFFLKTSDYVIRIMLNVEGKTMVIIHKSKQEKLYQVFVYTVLYEDT